MKFISTRFAAAAMMATCALVAQAQTPPPSAPGSQPPGMHMRDPAQMQQHMQHMQQQRMERHQRRMDGLKRILQISPAQEGAFAAWANTMRPAQHMQRPARDEFARMSTPERIDRMRQMRAQRMAEQDRRADATKTFYAQLTPPQQKAFDEISLKMLSRRGHGGGGGMHGHRG